MNIEFTFEYPHTPWAGFHVFKKYYDYFVKKNKKIKVDYINSSKHFNGNPSGPYAAQTMVIKNKDNGKYLVVSYWDRPEEITWDGNGWDNQNCVEIVTSAGFNPHPKFQPFSYLPYFMSYDTLSLNALKISEKKKNNLVFRGYLYAERYNLSQVGLIDINDKKIFPETNYFQDLTNNKICLSLNGAGQICNRDMEILGAKSVLLREELTSKFYNELIPNYHYVTYEHSSDAETQSKIILEKFFEITKDKKLMRKIAENGYKWYQKNATVESNFKILKKIINIQKLD
jgi:hypothetical protein